MVPPTNGTFVCGIAATLPCVIAASSPPVIDGMTEPEQGTWM
jgi:hypothetical protein